MNGLNDLNGVNARRALHFLPLMRKIVDQEIFSQPVGAGLERAALIDAREVVDEAAQDRAVVEHEGVDRDALARDALDFL